MIHLTHITLIALVTFSIAHAQEPNVLPNPSCYNNPSAIITLSSNSRVSENAAYTPSISAACHSIGSSGKFSLDAETWPNPDGQSNPTLTTSELELIKTCFPTPTGANIYTIKFWIYKYNGATLGDRPMVLWVTKDSSNNVIIRAVVPPVAGESDHYAICRKE